MKINDFWFRNYVPTDASAIHVTSIITCMKDKYKEDYIRTQDIFNKTKIHQYPGHVNTRPFIRTASTMSCSVV